MKLTKSTVTLVACCSLIALFTGCASVMCGSKQKVALDSKPNGAEVLVYDAHGDVVFQKKTPCIANLNRRHPDYMQPANYVVLIKKEGFEPVQFPLTGILNQAYFANILNAGIGFAVDPVTGGMWTLTPASLDADLVTPAAGFFQEEGYTVSLKQETNHEPAPFLKAAKD
jgi:hypothetical protein